ncbi:helix-turn-helix transcriptional regulator [Streptomyces sp. SP18ES09]|uniref:helix-turn-helix domain-containing protein n=1 Tax=Streptomyces sp. SP18ES09 TaxID=3002532 RepID=UPI002E77200E|nr:helix-turn-helix transcriptional regulator [Streptomyces sp. SP18ES09]MEE1814266.1 helix-turn-helix transcriptional regulator [Streptomyces sp. SP18ES09]
MNTQPTKQRLVNPVLLRLLMKRTGTGREMSMRDLADIAGVPHQTIGHLCTGRRINIDSDTASRIAAAIGVDDDILWIPVQRAGQVALGPADEMRATAA